MSESLQAKLNEARKRWRALVLMAGAASVCAVMSASILISYHSDRLLTLTNGGRLAWLVTLILGLILSTAAFVARPLRRRLPDTTLASMVERRYPALDERLLTTVELAHAGAAAGHSSAFVASLQRETDQLAAPLNFAKAVPNQLIQRPMIAAGFMGCALLAQIALAPGAMAVWAQRILFPGADIPIYARTQVWVTPGDLVIARGEDLVLGVKVGGVLTDRAVLHYRFDQGGWAQAQLTAPQTSLSKEGDLHLFSFKLNDLQQSVTYYATAGDGRANPHTVRVEDRPAILQVRLNLSYPPHTRRPPEVVEATAGNIVAPVGTRVQVQATASKPLQAVAMIAEGAKQQAWRVDGERAEGDLTVVKDMSYSLHLTDRNGFEASPPPQYTVRAQPDEKPTVQIVRPGADVERTPGGVIQMRVTASDDYGVKELRLNYRVGSKSGSVPLPGADGSPKAASAGPWQLASLHLKPGDTLVYEAIARDNDAVSGPHTGRSASYRVTIIGAEEMRERLDSQMRQEEETLRQLIRRQREAQSQVQQAQRAGDRNRQSQAESAQRSLSQETTELSRRMQQTNEQLRDNRLGSSSAIQRREEASRSLDQLGRQAMPQAAESIRLGALSEASRQQEQIRREMERLAQEASRAPDASQMAQEAERLAREQQQLAEESALAKAQMGDRSPAQMSAQERARLNDLAQKQARLRAQTEALQRQLQQAAREAAERGQQNADALRRAFRQSQQAATTQKQSAAQRRLQSGQPSEAEPQQSDAARDLQELAENLDQAAMQQQSQMERRAEQLEQIADRLQRMATEQSRIARAIRSDPNTEQIRQLAKEEQGLGRQAEQVSPQISDVPRAQTAVNRARDLLNQAQTQLDKNDADMAAPSAQEATRQLFQAAMELRDAARKMQQQADARKMQRAVEQLAKEQRALQKQTQQLDRQRQNGSLSTSQQQRARQLSQQQSRLLERSQSLNPQMPSEAFRWALGEASRRMGNASRSLEQQNTGEDTQRQQEYAAQTLERIARSLAQQAQGAQQQAQSGGQQSSAEQQMSEAAGELRLAREMEAQIQQETTSLDQRRNRNPNRNMSADQQRELNYLNQAQRETQRITQRAAQQLRGSPEIAQGVQKAAEQMEDVMDMLQQSETGRPTQEKQGQIVRMLDRAIGQTQQAMRQQRQQRAQQQQQQTGSQQTPQQQLGGNQPASRTFAPVVEPKSGPFSQPDPRAGRMTDLSPRAQRAMREGRQERVPAEYRDLVHQYYKALSERGGGR
jgi:hypothetical protein